MPYLSTFSDDFRKTVHVMRLSCLVCNFMQRIPRILCVFDMPKLQKPHLWWQSKLQGFLHWHGTNLKKGQDAPVTRKLFQRSWTRMETRELICLVLSAAEITARAADDSVRSQNRMHPTLLSLAAAANPTENLAMRQLKINCSPEYECHWYSSQSIMSEKPTDTDQIWKYKFWILNEMLDGKPHIK